MECRLCRRLRVPGVWKHSFTSYNICNKYCTASHPTTSATSTAQLHVLQQVLHTFTSYNTCNKYCTPSHLTTPATSTAHLHILQHLQQVLHSFTSYNKYCTPSHPTTPATSTALTISAHRLRSSSRVPACLKPDSSREHYSAMRSAQFAQPVKKFIRP